MQGGRRPPAGRAFLQQGLIALALIAAAMFLPRLVTRLRQPSAVGRVDAASMKQRLDRGESQTILDVRGADEYRGELGHIPSSINVPLGDLPAALPRLETPRDKHIVVVCRTDKRSAKAAELLANAGYREIKVLEGGMEQWNRLGFPVGR